MRKYPFVEISRELSIQRLHSLYYFQLAPEDPLEGESHDFWELVYMDAGEAMIVNGVDTYPLRQGEVFIHAPNRYHQVRLVQGCSPNIFILSFTVQSASMDALQNRSFTTRNDQRVLLSRMLEEGAGLYGPLLDCHRDLSADRLPQADFGALQIIVNDLELLLISLIRQCRMKKQTEDIPSAVTEGEQPEENVRRLKEYMRSHLGDNLTFADCCTYLGMSGTALKALFRAQHEDSVMHCYQIMRVGEARRLLRSGRWNVTEVAAELGYPSCQAFSAQFRRLTGTSPTAYLRRVAAVPELITTRSVKAKPF